MIYGKIIENEVLNTELKCEDVVWACMYEYTYDKEAKKLFQKPVKGVITASRYESYHNDYVERLKNSENYGREGYGTQYFVPFKKNGKDLAWSKAVKVYNRRYARNEVDCIHLFNRLILNIVDWHNKEIEELKKEML